MSDVLRHHEGGINTIEHWGESAHLADKQIDTITDPAGMYAGKQITSIPSPFARMDLVKSAFKFVAARGLEGNSIYHRIVADCLDIAEVFFNYNTGLQEKIEIISWNPGITIKGQGRNAVMEFDATSDLGKMLASKDTRHKLLAETLKVFLSEDHAHFNFRRLQRCFLLNYKAGPQLLNIIGGTSPATLFFSSANDLSYVDVSFGNYKLFDGKYTPLAKRGKSFVAWFFSLRAAFDNFSETFPDVHRYLDTTFEQLEDDDLRDQIKKIQPDNEHYTTYNGYSPVELADNNHAEILGFVLRAKNLNAADIIAGNDFIMQPTKKLPEGMQPPCVLPTEPGYHGYNYVGGPWLSGTDYAAVPFKDEIEDIAKRRLPNRSHIPYPYLTVSDLLEPYIMQMPYPINNTAFFDGNYQITSGKRDHCFILPIKKAYFNYFGVNDVRGIMPDGKKAFELTQQPRGVKATLRIPIQNRKYVTFTRVYQASAVSDTILQADEKQNMGVVVNNEVNLAIYPFIKLPAGQKPYYRVMLVDRDVAELTRYNTYQTTFYNETTEGPAKAQPQTIAPAATVQRSNKETEDDGVTTMYSVVDEGFDFLEVSNQLSKGILIPLFKALQPGAKKQFAFAIDLGTTNTHIEYKVDNDSARIFDISRNDVQIGTLSMLNDIDTKEALRSVKLQYGASIVADIILKEFAPRLLYEKDDLVEIGEKFYQRTAIFDHENFNENKNNYALAEFNIPFWYNKLDVGYVYGEKQTKITPNLKWVDFKKEKKQAKRITAFMEQLLLLARNKVLLNGGNLAATRLLWFYPSSMLPYRRVMFQDEWNRLFKKYFEGAQEPRSMSESFAPFYYYYELERVRPHERPAVNVDIGGGTTDVVIYEGRGPVALTSFRFAANAVFGDGYGGGITGNGFVSHFEPQIKEILEKNGLQHVWSDYEGIKQNSQGKSPELVEFYFALANHQSVREQRAEVDFAKMLANDSEMKPVFLFFYAAIIYHIARLMQAKQQLPPQFITFSGNAAKLLYVITRSNNITMLSKYAAIIFKDVYNAAEPLKIECKLHNKPKEITCKGGLLCKEAELDSFQTLEGEIKTVLPGLGESILVPPAELKYTALDKNSPVLKSVFNNVNDFIDRFFNWHNSFNYSDYFGISPKNLAGLQKLLKENTMNDLLSGLEEKREELDGNTNINIEETLFFYPLKGAINRLAFKIYEDENNNQKP